MAIRSFTNYANIQPQEGWLGDVVENAFKGYGMQRQAAKMLQEDEQRRKLIEELTLGNQAQGIKNEFLRPGLEQGMRKGDLDIAHQELINRFLPQEKQAHIGLANEQSRHYQLANELDRQYGARDREANLGFKEAQAASYKLTPTQRELAQLYGMDSPEFKSAMEAKHGIYTNEQGERAMVPEGAVSLVGAPANDRNRVYKEQSQELQKIQGLKNAYHSLDQAKKLIDENPNIASSAAAIIVNPGNKSIIAKLGRASLNKKELAAVEKLDKIFSNVVLQMGTSLGAKAFTDMKATLIDRAKGSFTNTDEANRFIIDNMMREIYPEIAYEKDLKKVYRKFELPFYRDNYPTSPSEMVERMQQPQQLQAEGMPQYSQEDLEYTAATRGISVDEVKRMLGIS